MFAFAKTSATTAAAAALAAVSWAMGPIVARAQHAVSGTVTEAGTGVSLLGATIREANAEGGTVTDLDGAFSLTLSGPDAVLEVGYVGMATARVEVAGRAVVDIALAESTARLRQAVVTGYTGATEQRDLVGSYAEVGEEELLADRPLESVDQLLEGRVAGVQVETVTGEPGLPIRVNIRGQTSAATGALSASTQPLYLLDGVRLFDALETNGRSSVFSEVNSTALNPLSLINPDDIASVTVLKDASATALYGADAANGVVLITTKQGGGNTRLSASVSYGTGRPVNDIQFLTTAQYLELARETLFNTGENPAEAGRSDVDTDWRRLVQQNPRNLDVDLTAAGGSDAGLRYRLTAGYSEIESVHIGNGLRQGNLNLNLTLPLGDRLRLATRLSGAYQRKEGLRSFDVFSFPPNQPVRNADGTFNNEGFFERRANPVALLEQNENYQSQRSTNAQATLHYDVTPGLDLRVLGGIDDQGRDQFRYQSALNGSGARRGGRLILSDFRNTQWIANAQASYAPEGLGPHHPSALAGGELLRQVRRREVAQGTGFPNDEVRRLAVLGKDDTQFAESVFEQARASAYGQLAYDYDYRYYVKLNVRSDASSIFGGDRQADVFWAVGAAWNFANEAGFAERRPLGIDYGKLRASYGVTGNSRIGVYTAQGTYLQEFADENYGGALPAFAQAPPNQDLGWERERQINLGLDLGWDVGRYGVTVEYYDNRTTDGLYSFDTPRESGFMSILANTLEIRNRGYEMTVTYAPVRTDTWRYNTSFNVAHNRNRLLSLAGVDNRSGNDLLRLVPGRDINLLYAVEYAGVNSESGTMRWRLPDGTLTQDGDVARQISSRVAIGRSVPDFYGGWHQTLGYGAVSATLQINYSYGATALVDPLTFTDGRQILFNNQSVNQLDRWQQAGDVTDVPRLRVDNAFVRASSRYAYDLNYVQLSTLSLNVDLVRAGWSPRGVEAFSAYALVNNLAYFYDEERRAGRNGIREYRFTFPQQRSITLGAKLTW